MRGLGIERFGVLALALTILGSSSILDLGVARAAIRFAAGGLGPGERGGFAALVGTSLLVSATLGAVGGLALALAAPLLASALFGIGPLADESAVLFEIVAAIIPIALVSTAARAPLEAGQRFDLVNLVGTPSTAATYLLSAFGAAIGWSLPMIGAILFANRLVALAALLVASARAFPHVWTARTLDGATVHRLLGFGGWLTISNVVSPVLLYADRLVLARALGAAPLAFYTVPSDLLARSWILPSAGSLTLYPAYGSHDAGDRARLYARGLTYLATALAPLLTVAFVLADDFLRWWLGAAFADQGALVLRVLAVGFLFSSLTYAPSVLLQAIGRPDLPAKVHLAELAPFLALTVVLTPAFGIIGTACAWSARAVIETLVVLHLASRQVPQAFAGRRLARALAPALVLAPVAGLLSLDSVPWPVRWVGCLLMLAGHAALSWRFVLDPADRAFLPTVLRGGSPT